MDSQGRLFVGDRVNNRIEIFDQDGTFPPSGSSSGVRAVFTSTAATSLCRRFRVRHERTHQPAASARHPDRQRQNRPGVRVHEDIESDTTEPSGAEGVGADAAGHIFGAVVRRKMLERFTPVVPAQRP